MNMPGMITGNSMFPPNTDCCGNRSIDYWLYHISGKKIEIEDALCRRLEDVDMIKNAFVFIDSIRAAKMKIKRSSTNVWSVKYKGKHVLDIIVEHGSWRVRLVFDHIKPGSIIVPIKAEDINNIVGMIKNIDNRCDKPIAHVIP